MDSRPLGKASAPDPREDTLRVGSGGGWSRPGLSSRGPGPRGSISIGLRAAVITHHLSHFYKPHRGWVRPRPAPPSHATRASRERHVSRRQTIRKILEPKDPRQGTTGVCHGPQCFWTQSKSTDTVQGRLPARSFELGSWPFGANNSLPSYFQRQQEDWLPPPRAGLLLLDGNWQ